MRVVLLSGGSGKRLWPLSNEIRSKAYLKLLAPDPSSPLRESMIQRVCRQLGEAGLWKDTLILTHESQVEITRAHVGDAVKILSEPHKRGTFTAAALAASYIHSQLGADEGETLCVLPVDSCVDTEFFRLAGRAAAVLDGTGVQLALIGTQPAYPSTQYGYIIPEADAAGAPIANARAIARFAEKPSEAAAREMIAQGALWNCGVFLFKVGFMLDRLRERGLPTGYESLLARYPELPEASFDEEVAERTRSAVVLPYQGTWEDLGSWAALSAHLDSAAVGPGQVSPDSRNTHLVNELPYPIHVIGLSNAIVAASADGILVAAKEEASRIKAALPGSDREIRFEETHWGTRRMLDLTAKIEETGGDEPAAPDGSAMQTAIYKVEMKAGCAMAVHAHDRREEWLLVLSGRGEALVGGSVHLLNPGDKVPVPAGTAHAIRAFTALTALEVHRGPAAESSGTRRIATEWP
ncbi:sugar phosphate nucleotidyltransferase [Gorillibacterium sp. sgz500922]|uniref:sugar phosphate nucleotidyltransferase n=1 Tax=Gorillibacterium sp. sgz500922 TaxID=3446694 RepID=UPI003F669A1F